MLEKYLHYTVSAKAIELVAEIAATLERYKIVMEGPNGVRSMGNRVVAMRDMARDPLVVASRFIGS